MPNFIKIYQMKKFSIQPLDPDRLVCTAAICYIGMISVPAKEQLIGEKRAYEKFQTGISKTEELFRVYTDRQTDRWLNYLRV